MAEFFAFRCNIFFFFCFVVKPAGLRRWEGGLQEEECAILLKSRPASVVYLCTTNVLGYANKGQALTSGLYCTVAVFVWYCPKNIIQFDQNTITNKSKNTKAHRRNRNSSDNSQQRPSLNFWPLLHSGFFCMILFKKYRVKHMYLDNFWKCLWHPNESSHAYKIFYAF